MDKKLLRDYSDANALIREIEGDIDRVRARNYAQDCVRGSMRDFPYIATTIRIQGEARTGEGDRDALRYYQEQLEAAKARAEAIKREVDAWMLAAPARIQRIVRYRFFDGLPWESVASRMGGRATENSIKKEFERFCKKN